MRGKGGVRYVCCVAETRRKSRLSENPIDTDRESLYIRCVVFLRAKQRLTGSANNAVLQGWSLTLTLGAAN